MDCTSCGDANRPGARFCGSCGKPLAVRCSACGTESEVGKRFCDACGASLVAAAAPATEKAEARKVVTIVFADLIGSTALHERLDAESARRLMDRYYWALQTVVKAHGGTVVKLLGDGVMAAFGVPRVAEDDAIRAVRAAVGMVEAVGDLGVGGRVSGVGPDTPHPTPHTLSVRVAVNTGEVVVSADNTDVVGDPVNVAARLQQEARDGEVLIGESTRRLVSDLVTLARCGDLALKGRAETVAAYRVVSLERPAGAAAAAFVGRDEELQRLMAVYAAAVTARGARLAVILGSPGLGKSRLLDEFSRRVGTRTTVLAAQCDSAGGATFAPVAKAIRMRLHIDDGSGGEALRAAISAAVPSDDADHGRITSGIAALLAGTPAPPEETFFVVRRLLGGLAAAQPVVLAIDDLQWAEPLLLDLVEHLVQWTTGVPLLVLAAARPELRAVRSSLAAAGGLVADVVTLAGLDAGAATCLAANVIGADALPAAVAGRVLATSEGNPLFLGELVRMLVNDGVLTREGDRWTSRVALADLDMPPTIHALLAARIERLRPEDRIVLERAAVVGRQFSRAAVAHLLPSEAQDDLDARFESLQRSELIEPDASWFLGEPALRFHHNLIRDAAYRRLLKGTRAEQHGRIADWIETRVAESVEYDEMIGWHLEQAHQHLRELGPIDEQGRAFGERAARYLATAGRRALARDDVPVAGSLLGRALERLGDADPARAGLALDWCEALLAAGNVGQAEPAIAELDRCVGDDARLRAWHTCFTGQLAVLTAPQALRATIDAVAGAAAALAVAGDAAGEAKAHSVHALALVRLGQVGACEAALDRALAAARRAQDRRRANAVLAGAPLAALWGPSPVTRASGRCLDVVRVLRITQGAPAVEAVALRCQAVLEALRGRTVAARRMIASSRSMVEELGITQRLLEADVFAGLIELLDGDAAAAERCLRSAYDGLRAHGLGIDAAQAAALLGRALLAQERPEEAEALTHESEALAGDDLKAAIAWRGVRAEALARRGEHTSAVDLARAAVDIAAATDALLDHADARQALAAALRACGRSVEADCEEARAIELWETKGATLLAERARRDSRHVAPASGAPDGRAAPVHPTPRRIQANAATASLSRFHAAARARDLDTLTTLIADDIEVLHHPTGATIRLEEGINRFRLLFRTEDLVFAAEPLATLGDALLLARDVTSFARFVDQQLDFGESQSRYVNLSEVDRRGQLVRVEVFAETHLGDAIAKMYQRNAELLAESCDRNRAAATARSVAALLGPFDFDCYATAIAPTVEFADHRTIGFPSGRGADALLRSLRTLGETADAATTRVDDILALRPDAFLVRWTTSGIDRVSRGPFEWQFLRLCVFGADGLLARAEQFDVERAEEALARFDEFFDESQDRLVPSTVEGRTAEAPAARFENAATRSTDRFDSAWESRDWQRVVALFPPGVRNIDRRTMVRLELTRDEWLESLRPFFSWTPHRLHRETLATRGDRLALSRRRFEGTDGAVGPSEFEWLDVFEVDEHGEPTFTIAFDPNDLDAAYAELDARYAGGATSPKRAALTRAFTQAFAAHDWSALAALLAPDLVVNDHRLLGWETLHGPAAYIQALKQLVDLAPDVELRVDHLTMSEPRFLYVTTWVGTHEGGAFETPSVIVCELDATDRIRRFDQYDLDQLEEARALVEATESVDTSQPNPPYAVGSPPYQGGVRGGSELLQDQPPPSPLLSKEGVQQPGGESRDPFAALTKPNAATASADRVQAAFAARDWAAMRAVCRSDAVFEDRRRHVLLSGDVGRWIADAKGTAEAMPDVSSERQLVATFGERVALERVLWSGAPTGARVEVEYLALTAVDASGQIAAVTSFDLDNWQAAHREAWARCSATDAAMAAALQPLLELIEAWNSHDRDRVRAVLADDVVMDDHRRVVHDRVEGADAFVATLAALWQLAPDIQIDLRGLSVLAYRADGTVTLGRDVGTFPDGGAFERQRLVVSTVRRGRINRLEFFEVDDLDAALARFGELRPDPTRVSPNAALRLRERINHAFMAKDWEAMRALATDDLVFEDRRKFSMIRGGVDLWIKSSEAVQSMQVVSLTDEEMGVFGDRIEMRHRVVTGTGPDGGAFESGFILLTQIDANGKLVASINFDPEARSAAFAEAHDRFLAGEGATVGGQAPVVALTRAVTRHDWNAVRECLAADAVIRDRRTLGLGTLSRDEWIASLRAQAKIAPHMEAEAFRILAWNAHGRVESMRVFGTTRDGGPFEKVLVAVHLVVGNHIQHHEVFDVADVDRALARFAELCSAPAPCDPLRRS